MGTLFHVVYAMLHGSERLVVKVFHVVYAMLYGSERLVVKDDSAKSLGPGEKSTVRQMYSCNVRDGPICVESRCRLGIEYISKVIRADNRQDVHNYTLSSCYLVTKADTYLCTI